MNTSRPIGRSPLRPAAVLDTPIPPGLFGRKLSTTELAALASLDIQATPRWIVVRAHHTNAERGICYYPYVWGVWGYAHAGVYVKHHEGDLP